MSALVAATCYMLSFFFWASLVTDHTHKHPPRTLTLGPAQPMTISPTAFAQAHVASRHVAVDTYFQMPVTAHGWYAPVSVAKLFDSCLMVHGGRVFA